ncbi:MAG: hypothetical protein J5742_04290 [Alphaproteobacteria bacterium]|nr:hypothetical protein [Alphaproteobacteria bacterium]
MQVYITDLTQICNYDDLVNKLPYVDMVRYKSFTRGLRAKQFLIAHSIKNKIANKFKYISIAHKDNIIIVGASNKPIGIDIEDTSIKRDFDSLANFMGFSQIKNQNDFYRAFTASEAHYKSSLPIDKSQEKFYKLNKYMICIVSDTENIQWINTNLIPEQI